MEKSTPKTTEKKEIESNIEIKEPAILPESTITEIKDENEAPDWTKLARFFEKFC